MLTSMLEYNVNMSIDLDRSFGKGVFTTFKKSSSKRSFQFIHSVFYLVRKCLLRLLYIHQKR